MACSVTSTPKLQPRHLLYSRNLPRSFQLSHGNKNELSISATTSRKNVRSQSLAAQCPVLQEVENVFVENELQTFPELNFNDQTVNSDSIPKLNLHFEFLALLLAIAWFLLPLAASASTSGSIATSSFGQKIASFLRKSGFPDTIIVFLMASLPVLELRGAIPVAYWMGIDPLRASTLSVVGNMVPVPFILLFLGPVCDFLSQRSKLAKSAIDWLLKSTRNKAGPIEEFKWLGLMLFVAVPLPGTGAWSGAMAAYVLGMEFWSAYSANFVGVILAAFLVNTLCNLGLRSALLLGLVLFIASSFVWTVLRFIQGRFTRKPKA